MKRKHLFAILAAVALGLLLYAPTLIRSPGGGPAPTGEGLAFEALDPAAIERIRILHADGDTVRLERTDRGWRTNGWEADSLHVADLLAAVDTMRATQVVARNPDNHARLEVTPETGRVVELHGTSGDSWRFIVGSRELGTGGYHVRLPGEDRVWLLRGPVGGYTGRATENWRERYLTRLDTARAREILLRRGETEVVLRRADDAWTLGDGAVADTAATGALLRRLAALRAPGFPPDSIAAATDFGDPEAMLSVFGEEGGDVTDRALLASLRFLPSGEEGLWLVKRAGEPEVFELPVATVDDLLPSVEALTGGGTAGEGAAGP